MASKKITLSSSRDIPFDRLVLSQANVRRVKAGVSIEELAEDIARRGLLQGLSVRAVVDADGAETGMWEIPAGGRRYRALELLVRRKRLARTAAVPCIVREGGLAEEDSLAENVQRAPLHPLDQFRAFLALREKGRSEEEIAAAFFVSVAVVRQRLRLASVSSRLLDAYAEDRLGLDQLMAFTVSGDHARQERVFEALDRAYDKQPYAIRRMLTEGAVRASDKRAQFVGLAAYEAAGGTVLRDLFQGDDGGWWQDAALVDRLVAEALKAEADRVAAEGWHWVEAAPDFPYGHSFGLRRICGTPQPVSAEDEAAKAALEAEQATLLEVAAEGGEISEETDARLGEIETALERLADRPLAFAPEEIARAGVFVSITHDGSLRVERGWVRPEDEAPIVTEGDGEDVAAVGDPGCGTAAMAARAGASSEGNTVVSAPITGAEPAEEEDDGLRPLSDRLMTELTSFRTVGLRHALGERPDVAFQAALHALTLSVYYHYRTETCLELDLRSPSFGASVPGLAGSTAAEALTARHEAWRARLPREAVDLWTDLALLTADEQAALFAHVVSLSVNAVHEPWNRRPRALAHADRLAAATGLDMTAAGWSPTVDGYLGRVTKARILEAVTEAKGEAAADRIAHLKKGDMAAKAEQLLAGSGWLPEPLRTPGRSLCTAPAEHAAIVDTPVEHSEPAVAEPAASDGETAIGDPAEIDDTGEAEDEHLPAVAAE